MGDFGCRCEEVTYVLCYMKNLCLDAGVEKLSVPYQRRLYAGLPEGSFAGNVSAFNKQIRSAL